MSCQSEKRSDLYGGALYKGQRISAAGRKMRGGVDIGRAAASGRLYVGEWGQELKLADDQAYSPRECLRSMNIAGSMET